MKKIALFSCMFLTFFFANAHAEEDEELNILSVQGYAEIHIPAEYVVLDFGFYLEGDNPDEIEISGHEIGLQIKDILEEYNIDDSNIISTHYDLNKYKQDNITYHFVSNHYSIKFFNFEYIDTFKRELFQVGATEFQTQKITAGFQSMQKALNTVRQLAFKNAKVNAESILQDSDIKLGKAILIEGDSSRYYVTDIALGAVGGYREPPKISPLKYQNKIKISSLIKVKFEIE